jgi:hypothetical protein
LREAKGRDASSKGTNGTLGKRVKSCKKRSKEKEKSKMDRTRKKNLEDLESSVNLCNPYTFLE